MSVLRAFPLSLLPLNKLQTNYLGSITQGKKRMPPLCKHCGQPVWGEYITAMGETWHPVHFRCADCGLPISGDKFQVFQGQPYHVACYLASEAPRCVYCQKPLIGRYLVDGWGNKFCEEHQKQYPHCSFCSRLIPPQQQTPGWKFDESLRCVVCRFTAVETAEQAQVLFTRLKEWIRQQGFRFNQTPLRLELCSRTKLEQLLHGRTHVHLQGVTLSSKEMENGRVVSSRIDGVAVLSGMPANLFSGVVLHELGHVWLIVHGIENLPPWAEEGFCQLLSHRYYTTLTTPEARHRATDVEDNGDPIYGEGFRRIRALSERMGFQRFVETLRTTKRLPL
jgi:hypothetical protein